MRMIKTLAVFAALILLSASKCDSEKSTGKASWDQVLSKCGVGDLHQSKILYFGAANGNGVGSIWSVDKTTGDYWPTSQLSDVSQRTDIVFSNKEFACSGDATTGMEFDVAAGAKPVLYPVSGEVQAAMSNANSVKVKVSSIVQEDAYWDRFNTELQKLGPGHVISNGIEMGNRVVVARAWKVRGFTAVITYQSAVSGGVKAAVDAKVASGTLGVTAKWKDANTLELSSTQDLYIAGAFRALSPQGVSAATTSTEEFVDIHPLAKVRPTSN